MSQAIEDEFRGLLQTEEMQLAQLALEPDRIIILDDQTEERFQDQTSLEHYGSDEALRALRLEIQNDEDPSVWTTQMKIERGVEASLLLDKPQAARWLATNLNPTIFTVNRLFELFPPKEAHDISIQIISNEEYFHRNNVQADARADLEELAGLQFSARTDLAMQAGRLLVLAA